MAKNEAQRRELAIAQIKGAVEPRIYPLTYNRDLIEYLNYHNACSSDKDKRKWLYIGLLKDQRNDIIESLHSATDFEIRQVSVLMRARDRGDHLEPEHLAKIEEILQKLHKKYSSRPVVEDEVEVKVDKTEITARRFYGEIVQGAIDEWVLNRTPFDMKAALISNNIKAASAEIVGDLIAPTLIEVSKANQDVYLKEAYRRFDKKALTAFILFLQTMVQDCFEREEVVKATRKPRESKKPSKSPVAKLKYLKAIPALNLRSIDPEKIIGADELFAYRDSRKFVYWKALPGKKLEIKGQSVVNYDPEKSGAKTVRKPEELFKNLNMAKKALKDLFDNMMTSVGEAPSRIIDDMVLIKTF